MMLGFGHGLLFLLPLLFLAKFFWIVILVLLIGAMIRRFSFRQAHRFAYQYGMPPAQPFGTSLFRSKNGSDTTVAGSVPPGDSISIAVPWAVSSEGSQA